MTSPKIIRGLTSKSLVKAIFDAENPEQFVRSLPAQSLYLAIKQNGLASSTDLIELCSTEQTRLLLDFDLWEKDRFSEERFWEWIELSDDSDPLKHSQKLLKSIDLKLISLLASRFVSVKIFDEPTENPPGPLYYTPDKGFTWILISIEDPRKHFLFTRFLALIFETSAELFYQLLSIPQVSTESILEEDSYQERTKRMACEGFPDPELTSRINFPLDRATLTRELSQGKNRTRVEDVRPIEPLLYDTLGLLQPLSNLFEEIKDREEFEAELTLIMNASLLNFSVPFYEYEEVIRHTEKVKGALNVGLEVAMSIQNGSAFDAYNILGLELLYRAGLNELKKIRKAASIINLEKAAGISPESAEFSIVAHARLPLPEAPAFLNRDGSYSELEGRLKKGSRAIEYLKDVETILEILKRYA